MLFLKNLRAFDLEVNFVFFNVPAIGLVIIVLFVLSISVSGEQLNIE